MRLRNPAPLDAYEGRDRLPSLPAPTIAIPTTAGSGSEVSTVVVLHDANRAQHLVVRGRGYEPDVALLDGSLLRTLPEPPLVQAALDALSHALEALWAHGATRFTDTLALAAAADIRAALPRAIAREDDAMQTLMEASAMANLACGNAGLGLVHALTSAPDVHLPARLPERRPAPARRGVQPPRRSTARPRVRARRPRRAVRDDRVRPALRARRGHRGGRGAHGHGGAGQPVPGEQPPPRRRGRAARAHGRRGGGMDRRRLRRAPHAALPLDRRERRPRRRGDRRALRRGAHPPGGSRAGRDRLPHERPLQPLLGDVHPDLQRRGRAVRVGGERLRHDPAARAADRLRPRGPRAAPSRPRRVRRRQDPGARARPHDRRADALPRARRRHPDRPGVRQRAHPAAAVRPRAATRSGSRCARRWTTPTRAASRS